jgi:phage terminase large subunit-like protein
MFGITTAGYENEGIYDELIKRSTALLNGNSKETRLAPFLYMIDDPEKWNDINEIRKANPNLGVSVSVDYMLEEIAIAEGSLSKKYEFLCKYCCVKQSSASCWLPAEDVRKVFGYKRTLEEFRNHYCLGGIDLSQTTDLTSACVLIEKDGIIWVHSHFWMPANRIDENGRRDGVPYRILMERGFLSPSGEEFINNDDVFAWFQQLVKEYKIFPLQIGYDRYSAQDLVQKMEKASFHMESVFQGWNLTGIEDTFEGMLREGRIRGMDDNDLLKIHMMDSAQQIERNTSAHSRKKLVKISKYAHVDGVAAILDAMCMRQNHWAEMGKRLMNGGG